MTSNLTKDQQLWVDYHLHLAQADWQTVAVTPAHVGLADIPKKFRVFKPVAKPKKVSKQITVCNCKFEDYCDICQLGDEYLV